MDDEVSEDYLEEKGSPRYVEDSYEADSFIPLSDVIDKWSDILKKVVTHQNPYHGERVYNNLMNDKWGDYKLNFMVIDLTTKLFT